MRRSSVMVVAVSLSGLLTAGAMLASLAEARVGGGGSSGSRGSRSYSAPRAPASPLTPATPGAPPRPTAPGGPGAGMQPRPSLFGGLGGMLGGFLLGGFIGSLLFGGLGGLRGGLGLMDLLVMGGLAALVISFLRRRAPEPAPAAAYGGAVGGTSAPGPVTGASAPVSPSVAAPSDADLAQGIEHIRGMDPGFDPARFLDIARDLFLRLQIGWSGGDLAAVRAHLTDEMATALEGDLARLRERRRRNRVEQVAVESIGLTEAWQEYGRDLVTVEVRARALDTVLDEVSGQVVEGSATLPTHFVEYWTFVRPVGPHPWRLGAIQQASA
jgi:predicted lipid-binding transport protein (Tim44 family)